MTGSSWREPGYRRDVLIVVGLLGLGLLFNVLVGIMVVLLFDLLGLWGALSEARSVEPGLRV